MSEIDYASIVAGKPRKWVLPKVIGIAGGMEHGKDTIANLLHARFSYQPVGFATHLKEIVARLFNIPDYMLHTRAGKAERLIGMTGKWTFPFQSSADFNHLVMMVLEFAYDVAPGVFQQAMTRIESTERVGQHGLKPKQVAEGILVQMQRHIYLPLMNGKVFTSREIMQLVGTEIFRAVDPPFWIWAWEKRAKRHELVVVPDVRFDNEADKLRNDVGALLWRVQRPDYASETLVNKTHVSETIEFTTHAVLMNSGDIPQLWECVTHALAVYARERQKTFDKTYAVALTC